MRDGNHLKRGDVLSFADAPRPRALVDDVTTNYVKLVWGPPIENGDMLRKSSPLWQLLEQVV